MKRLPALLLFTCGLWAADPQAPATAPVSPPQAAAGESTDFIRFEPGETSDHLQTAIVSYESPQKVRVDLVGAIHIADKVYFDSLNTRFKAYDAVLYELVGPAFTERGKAPAANSQHKLAWVGQLQAKMKETLKLHGQLESIDYQAKNFVHADMGAEQFTDSQEQKNESFLTLYLKAALAQKDANAKSGMDSDAAGLIMLLKLLTAKDTSTGLKRMIAQQFDTVEDIMAGVESGQGTALLGERNRVALEVMDKQIAAGKKNLAIFYGAAHLGDMEERLLKKGFKRTKVEWITAWDLPHEE
ncbi:MAG: hypothetical protein IAE77_28710 [Prosthecobacter sp.]|uniref:hypothetical protein n=1 Tax=Prosthecobacter sp. TaxID=1965333 RepID=UPI0019E633E3|nr:hypothetical protein [Prosthecobacter sp.]MBE2287471.1 hypothetical protein [Prosthecobacter sp.]